MTEDSTDTCPECGGQFATDSERGETVCRDCGLVVKEGDIDYGTEWGAFDTKENHTTQDDFIIPNSDDISPADIQPHADLSGGDLSEAALRFADLTNADLSEADLSDADLSGPPFGRSGTDLSGADLSGADLKDAEFTGANLTNADLSDTKLARTTLRNADLRDADLSGADFSDAKLRSADLRDADLSGADFQDANIRNSRFNDGQLSSIQFEHTLYEDAPARADVEFEYIEPDNPESDSRSPRSSLEIIDSELTEIVDTGAPALSCDCGKRFDNYDAAVEHLKRFRN